MCIRKPVRIGWVIERWRSDKQARDVRRRCHCILRQFQPGVSRFFAGIQQDEIIANTYFFSSVVLLFRAESPGNKDNLRTI